MDVDANLADALVTIDDVDDSADLSAALSAALEDKSLSLPQRLSALESILTDPSGRFSVFCVRVKESAVYEMSRSLCNASMYTAILPFLTTTCSSFFDGITKAKTAKIVRQVLDILSASAPSEHGMLVAVCLSVIAWCTSMKRTFLRQRVESKLASVHYLRGDFPAALSLVTRLLGDLKKLDDKQLLVETHLVEAKVYHGLKNYAKAKASLTASRTAANAIYVSPALQAELDEMSGVLHCEEGDYNTAHSYFLEAFEQLDQLADKKRAVPNLKYMILCRILDSIGKQLKASAKGLNRGVQKKYTRDETELSGLVTGKQGVKYAGLDVDAMMSIADAATKRSLKDFEATTLRFKDQLQTDLLIQHHLNFLYEQLLESNLVRIIEPFSCVEISHVAKLIELPVAVVERKLSQMILDDKFQGILDQGKGQLIVHEAAPEDTIMDKGLVIIGNMEKVVEILTARSQKELAMK